MNFRHIILSISCLIYSLPCEGRPGADDASLYSDQDKITLLNATNIKSHIIGSNSAWLVEFYSSWCGHCINFAPTFKLMAADVYAWRDVITVGAIDCANEANTETCREFEIMGYPTMKFFPRDSKADFKGDNLGLRAMTVDAIRNEMTNYLLKEEEKKADLLGIWPKLIPTTDVSDLKSGKAGDNRNILLILEDAESKVGMEVMLDFHLPLKRLNIPMEIQRSVYNPKIDYGVVVSKRPAVLYYPAQNNNKEPKVVELKDQGRQGIYNAIKDYLWKESPKFAFQDSNAPLAIQSEDSPKTKTKSDKAAQVDNSSKSKKNLISRRYTVYLSDLEKAAVYALSHEIAQHQTIAGEALEALRKFVTVLDNHFPARKEFASVLKDLHYWVHQHEDAIRGEDLGAVVKSSLAKYGLEMNDRWVGCQGSKPQYGGYPCGLWSLWHALTVKHSVDGTGHPRDVMMAMKEYIQEYFGCRECARHFDQAIQNGDGIVENVMTHKDSVLYLWHIHNKVNFRLAGDLSEDPQYPKQTFPAKEFCSKCYIPTTGSNLWDEFDREEIYSFLVTQFSKKISKQGISNPSAKTSALKNSKSVNQVDDFAENLDLNNFKKPENGKFTVNFIFFNGADLSLYMILWLISAIMIILLYLKFVSKRWLRPKHYFYGQKVGYNPLVGKV